ncbi:dihydrodipicolinate synthase family protein [Chitinophaga sp. GCM10012297]|uniref:Dihydrodipicolinate synthase family protein n=1 Tax=Chitinophaga chungangae TaxID=2821488 RepID=A0ABS3YJ34_9BACT|nr:dihydrodipicolinate synthase family protein [Chitinophaga chungangae]MBO9154700.1 dihydrodipicolinate synthase family protein [Chitinophaga chungangae]
MNKITGLIAATFAAYHEDGRINLDIIPAIVDKMIADGLAGVFICGTNGEGPNLKTEERMAIAEAYVKAAQKRILVLVHVGHSSISECRKLAAHAEQIGADAISSVAAFYFKPTTVSSLVKCMAKIASAAPNTPFYYYNIPTLTGVALDMVSFLTQAEEAIPTLAGIKYTASTLHEYQACLNYKNGKFDILFGYDEMLLSALAVGAKGAIGSTYTFAAPIYHQVIKLYNEGKREQAAKWQLHSVNMVRCLVKYPPIPAQRAIMQIKGMELGDCRLPLEPLSAQDTQAFKAELTEIGFFDLVN